MAMLRTLHRRGTMPDVRLLYSAPTAQTMIFRDELRRLKKAHATFDMHEQHTAVHGMLDLQELDVLCPDWRERHTWACGPPGMLDAATEFWKAGGVEDRLHLERFSVELVEGAGGDGGHVVFEKSGKEVDADGATTLLEAGEQVGITMPFGCRMGICHTCTVPLASGRIRDLRNGDEHAEQNESIQTCVSVAAGDCVLDI
jgi:ferredoxin-NADP reductase